MKQRERHDTENDALRAETEIYSKFELKFVAFYANMIFKNERNVAWILGCPKKPFCCTRKLILLAFLGHFPIITDPYTKIIPYVSFYCL